MGYRRSHRYRRACRRDRSRPCAASPGRRRGGRRRHPDRAGNRSARQGLHITAVVVLAEKGAAVIGPFEDDRLAGEIAEADGLPGDVPGTESRGRRAQPHRRVTARLRQCSHRGEGNPCDRDNIEDPRCQVGHHAPPSDRGTLRIGKALPVVWSYRLGSALRRISNLPKFLPCKRPMKASGALSSPSTMSSRYLIWPLLTRGATVARNSGWRWRWSLTMKPWILRRLRTTAPRLGPGRSVWSLYSAIMPHMTMRPKSLSRGNT